MKRLILYILIFISAAANGQNRLRIFSDSSQTATGYYVNILRTFKIPVAADTSLKGGNDSLGSLLYVYTASKQGIWYRDTNNAGGHKWSPLQASSYTANRALVSASGGSITPSSVTSTELGYLSGVTSGIQAQIDAKQATSLLNGKLWVGNASNVPTAVNMSGDGTLSNAGALALASTGVGAGSCASCNLTFDAKGRITVAANGTGSGSISVVSGTTPISVATGTTTPVISIANGAADSATKGAVAFKPDDFNSGSGIISLDVANIQASSGSTKGMLTSTDWNTFNNKQPLITGAATTVVSSNLTAGQVVITNASGKLATSAVTSGVLTYLTGVSSNIQTQLNNKITTALTSGKILVGNGSNVAASVTMSGHATLSNAGVLTLATTGVTPGTYSNAVVQVDAYGRVIAAADGSGGGGGIGTVTNVTATSPISITGTSTVTPNVTIANAKADGGTKGAAWFNANDFNDNGSGGISLDITNIQAASASLKGMLTSTDWSTFNNKVATTRTITAGTGLTGGGTLAADRTISLNSIAGFIAAGSNVTLTGAGTIASPYTISSSGGGGGGGSVTSVSVVTANGVSGSVANSTTTPAITLTVQDASANGSTKGIATFLGADFNAASGVISLDTVNGHFASANTMGFLSSTDWGVFNSKEDNITGAATSVLTSNLSTNMVLISNNSGKIAASAIDTAHLGYLRNVTSDIQAQINSISGGGGGGGRQPFITLSVSSGTIAWNHNNSSNAKITFAAGANNPTIAITNDLSGDYGTLIITQPASGAVSDVLIPVGDYFQDGINVVGTTRRIDLSDVNGEKDMINYIKDADSGIRYWSFGHYHQ